MQHSSWHKVPVVRLLLAFSSGIGLSMFISFHSWSVLALLIISFLFMVWCPKLFHACHQKWITGMAVVTLFFCSGIYMHTIRNQKTARHFSLVKQPAVYLLQVAEEPVEKARSWKIKTRVIQCSDSSGMSHTTTGNLLLYLGKDTQQVLPAYGDVISIRAPGITEIPPPGNPGEFNYKRYLAFNYIYHQVYVRPQQIVKTGLNLGYTAMKTIYRIQHYFTHVLREYVKTPNEVGVAQALLYGYDDAIDAETATAYANTGTLHVLAVSGMHVGLILLILDKALFFLNKNKHALSAKRLLILLCIWIYSALCGLSPSILRATVMFSFVVLAQLSGRRSNIYNTLACSCFVLLCADPNMLANVGFQLSYLAVLGIVFLQPLIHAWYEPVSWIARQVWAITSVSVAAQLATCPIGILYFHQFPNCFLFSNLLIIPLTTLVIYACIALLACSWWAPASMVLGFCTQQLILFTNRLVSLVEQLPYSYVNGLQISIAQSILLYLLLFSSAFYFITRAAWLFKSCLVFLLLFTVILSHQAISHNGQKKLVVYGVSGSNAVTIISGTSSVLFLDSNLRYDAQKFRFHLQQHIWQMGISCVDTITNSNWQGVHAGKNHIILSGKNRVHPGTTARVLVIRNEFPVEDIVPWNPAVVVISGTIKKKKAREIERYCRKKNITVHNVLYSGAFELIL